MLVPEGHEKTVVIAAVIGAAVDLTLNLILIPAYAASGAAAATLAAEICVTGFMIYSVRDNIHDILGDIPVVPIAAGLAVSCVAGRLIKCCGAGALLTLCITSICCFGAYAAVMYFALKHSGRSRQ